MSYAVVTGASGGIGKALAFELANRGYDLVLASRNEQKLAEIASAIKSQTSQDCKFLGLDLSNEGAAKQLYEFCTQQNLPVSILINNAGYGLWGAFKDLTLDDQLNMMRLNMTNMVQLAHFFTPAMLKQAQSYILNVASTAAYQAVPSMSVYAASKSFVVLFSRGLRYELRKSSISVSVVSPGPVSSGFMNRAGMKEPWLIKRSEKYSMTPEQVAKITLRKMFKGKAEIVPGFLNALTVKLSYLSPNSLNETIAANLYKK